MKNCVLITLAPADGGSDPPEMHALGGAVFGDVGLEIILGTILNVILEFKMHPEFHCD